VEETTAHALACIGKLNELPDSDGGAGGGFSESEISRIHERTRSSRAHGSRDYAHVDVAIVVLVHIRGQPPVHNFCI
jgi:hypothetical protein